jgi:hypothetical protein
MYWILDYDLEKQIGNIRTHRVTKLGGNRTKYSITIERRTPPKTKLLPLL